MHRDAPRRVCSAGSLSASHHSNARQELPSRSDYLVGPSRRYLTVGGLCPPIPARRAGTSRLEATPRFVPVPPVAPFERRTSHPDRRRLYVAFATQEPRPWGQRPIRRRPSHRPMGEGVSTHGVHVVQEVRREENQERHRAKAALFWRHNTQTNSGGWRRAKRWAKTKRRSTASVCEPSVGSFPKRCPG